MSSIPSKSLTIFQHQQLLLSTIPSVKFNLHVFIMMFDTVSFWSFTCTILRCLFPLWHHLTVLLNLGFCYESVINMEAKMTCLQNGSDYMMVMVNKTPCYAISLMKNSFSIFEGAAFGWPLLSNWVATSLITLLQPLCTPCSVRSYQAALSLSFWVSLRENVIL